ncbi:nmrA-like family domain-containing protein 1 isoform X1 [Mytilus californianus]|uniref:nmrA-like family domain-containing protein 1 isoform X1 n=1 Tax=Mytilus californianus TaxID=6549 RepID=UPI002246EDD7|nr:nmrA-like family domain-containing protein 1 isoform X1 [Mytilus californianus]XP_052097235.1 nmrA-like family domain-containing protein 1 isoform X1 [Mytilus californianus]
MGCGSSSDAPEGPRTVVVFGATGLLGSSVARALLEDPFRFKVKCVTRRSSSDKARKLAELGAIIVTADLDDPKSLERAVDGADTMFLTTHYWEDKNKEKEVIRGLNAIDAAVHANIRHLVFNGSELVKKYVGRECAHLDSKAGIEEYIREVGSKAGRAGITYTIIRLPFWYENFFTIFKPHKIKHGVYAIALPLEDNDIEAISVEDVGECVATIFNKPKLYAGKTIGLTAGRLTMKAVVEGFNKQFSNRKFEDPKIRCKDFERFQFVGAKDLAVMFDFFTSPHCVRDYKLTKKLNSDIRSFDKWLYHSREIIDEELKKD